MMTKKHYEMIALIIRENSGVDTIISGLCQVFSRDNPKFDIDIFVDACTPDLTELCPHCEKEVMIKAVKQIQNCPECDKPIKPCSMCDMNTVKCNECVVHTPIGG